MGIDFALDASGRVVVFEANATMAIVAPGDDPHEDYRREPIRRASDAVRALIVERSHLGNRTLPEEERSKPSIAPEIVVEVRSPEDRELNVRRKTDLYLTHGATLVLNVDPEHRVIRLSDAQHEAGLCPGDVIEHPAFPDLHIPVAEIFAPLDLR